MKSFKLSICAIALAQALALSPVCAQQYAGGTHRLQSPQGELAINSGFVNNWNVHTFNVYSFLFKPLNSELGWQQVPVVERNDGSDLKFMVTTANTADFTLRDARVAVVHGTFELWVAQKIYQDSPYDDAVSVQLCRYVLVQTEGEERWIFQYASSRNLGRGTTIEQALNPRQPSRVKAK